MCPSNRLHDSRMKNTHPKERFLVTVADDLGRSSSINLAVAEARKKGILTSASIMAGGEAFDEAVGIALDLDLCAGVHVTLCDGKAVLPHSVIPDITDPNGQLEKNPSAAWMRYMRRDVLSQVGAEVEAQFERIEKAGIRATFVNGHHHLHMQPRVFDLVCRHASRRGILWVRIPTEPASIVLKLHSNSRGLMPFIEWGVFGMLSIYNLRTAKKYNMRATQRVYGLSRTEDVDEGYLLNILTRLDGSVNEFFLHPDKATASGRRELEALTSIEVRKRLDALGIRLTGYGGISGSPEVRDSAGELI
jgi:predicted glycoside hydrolase/deacetylase ChbG (UPF0249 family)